MARKLGSPSLSRLGVWRDLETQNRVTKYWTRTRTGGRDESGGTRTGGGDESGGTRIGVMAVDRWWRIWTRIGGEYVVVVYSSGDEVGAVVVYGSSNMAAAM